MTDNNMSRRLPIRMAGKAPDKLIAEKRDASGKVIRTRPLFPYPQVAK